MRKIILGMLIFAAGVSGSILRAQDQPESRPSKTWTDKGTVKATVKAINRKTREITLKGPDGNTVVVVAGPDVKNFDQIKKGDKVVADYYESTAIFVRAPGEKETPGKTSTSTLESAEPGEKPSATLVGSAEVTATVKAIDYENRTVLLLGPDGATRTVKVSPEVKRLAEVKKGDVIVARITKSVAISVQESNEGDH